MTISLEENTYVHIMSIMTILVAYNSADSMEKYEGKEKFRDVSVFMNNRTMRVQPSAIYV